MHNQPPGFAVSLHLILQSFVNILKGVDWSSVLGESYTSNNVNVLYAKFVEFYMPLYVKYFPVITKKMSRHKQPRNEWMTPC